MKPVVLALMTVIGIAAVQHQPDYEIRAAPQVLDEWARLGNVGRWVGCLYGRIAADTILLNMQVPASVVEGNVRCPYAMVPPDTVIRAIGTVHPLPYRGAPCEFTPDEKREFMDGIEQIRLRWCGERTVRVLKRGDPQSRRTIRA